MAGTLVLDGYDCSNCYPDVQRSRGCSRNGIPCPSAHLPVRVGGRDFEYHDCPQAMKTVEHVGLLDAYLHYRAGRQVYPSLQDYPARLLKQMTVIDREVKQQEARMAAAAPPAPPPPTDHKGWL